MVLKPKFTLVIQNGAWRDVFALPPSKKLALDCHDLSAWLWLSRREALENGCGIGQIDVKTKFGSNPFYLFEIGLGSM